MKKFLGKLKMVGIKDMGHLILFMLAIVPAALMRRKRNDMWLVCEYGKEARDNGYWFYKYMRENHKEQDVVYAIEFSAEDYHRVKELGECVRYGSLKHWIYYLCASVNISSHKGGKPNAAVCYLLEIYGLLKNKRVFLQHGITKDDADLFYYKNTKMRLFICGAKPEYDFVRERFGYPEENVVYTGFARFDQLPKQPQNCKRLILVAPTWRNWLFKVSSNPYENEMTDVEQTEYYQKWTEFLMSQELYHLLEKYQYELIFFPHRNMTGSFEKVGQLNPLVKCQTWKDADIQVLMKEAECMITDYSSTAMDFAYMGKPVLYYQFDEARYRSEHFKKGYFDYEQNGFGKVIREIGVLNSELKKLLSENCRMEPLYRERVKVFFPLRDNQNCERIYQEIKKL